MRPMQIFLLGQARIVPPDSTSPVKLTRACLSLLAYLLLQPQQAIPRERILGTFWGEHSESRARSCLNSALWRLRASLDTATDPSHHYVLSLDDGQVGFNWESTYWLDVERFEQVSAIASIAPQQMTQERIDALERACQVYAGELLQGYYDDWALRERERLRSLYLTGLSHLMQTYAHQGKQEQAVVHGQGILALDPLREEVHCMLMRLYLENGQRVKALRQYEQCRQALADELGVEPMEETQLLRAEIDGSLPSGTWSPQDGLIDYQQALNELRLVQHRVADVSRQISRTIAALEQCQTMEGSVKSAGPQSGRQL